MNTQEIGKLGENYAEKYLASQNYQILRTNFYCRFGEIDIIAIETGTPRSTGHMRPRTSPQLVFIEVKARTDSVFGTPQASITHSKKQKLLKTALHFLNSTSQNLPFSWRIDVIALKLNKSMKLKELTHFKNIFNG